MKRMAIVAAAHVAILCVSTLAFAQVAAPPTQVGPGNGTISLSTLFQKFANVSATACSRACEIIPISCPPPSGAVTVRERRPISRLSKHGATTACSRTRLRLDCGDSLGGACEFFTVPHARGSDQSRDPSGQFSTGP